MLQKGIKLESPDEKMKSYESSKSLTGTLNSPDITNLFGKLMNKIENIGNT